MKSCRCDPVLGHKLFFPPPPESGKLQREQWRPVIVYPLPPPPPQKRLGKKPKLDKLDVEQVHAGRSRLGRPPGGKSGLWEPARIQLPPV